MSHNCASSFSPDMRYPFDGRCIDARFRHAAVIGALKSMNSGETMLFVSDLEPLPLLDQIKDHFGDYVEVNYINREPGQIQIEFSLM